MLNREIFQKLCSNLGKTDVDLFASRLSKQLKKHVSWKTDPFSMGRDAFQISWSQGFSQVFPPFSLINKVLAKVQREKATLILLTPVCQTQGWFPKLSKMSIQNVIVLPCYPGLLTNPKREVQTLLQNQSLRLVA